MFHIIPTIDYELFGNGKGDVVKHMIRPADKLIDICDKYDAKVTLMMDFLEYEKFSCYSDELKKYLGYKPDLKIKNQIKNYVKNGLDVQLHIHPQWYDADLKNGRWDISNPKRPIDFFDLDTVVSILERSKKELERILKEVEPEYECKTLRLTNQGWTPPSKKIVNAMKKTGLKMHSLATTDHPKNNENGFWYLDKESNIVEIPIFGVKLPNYLRYTPLRVITALYRKLYQTDVDHTSKNNRSETKNYYFSKWDVCKMSGRRMYQYYKKATSKFDENKDIPLVMIGHTKDFFNGYGFIRFVKLINKNERKTARFSTMREFNEIIN